jgi:hypothetical protein
LAIGELFVEGFVEIAFDYGFGPRDFADPACMLF